MLKTVGERVRWRLKRASPLEKCQELSRHWCSWAQATTASLRPHECASCQIAEGAPE